MTNSEQDILVCFSCLARNEYLADICEICGAQLGATSHLDPIKINRTESFLLQKAVSERPKFIVLLDIRILCLPVFLITAAIATKEIFYGKGFSGFIFF